MQELFQSLRDSNKPNEPRPSFCNTYVLIYKSLLTGLIESSLLPAYLTVHLIDALLHLNLTHLLHSLETPHVTISFKAGLLSSL